MRSRRLTISASRAHHSPSRSRSLASSSSVAWNRRGRALSCAMNAKPRAHGQHRHRPARPTATSTRFESQNTMMMATAERMTAVNTRNSATMLHTSSVASRATCSSSSVPISSSRVWAMPEQRRQQALQRIEQSGAARLAPVASGDRDRSMRAGHLRLMQHADHESDAGGDAHRSPRILVHVFVGSSPRLRGSALDGFVAGFRECAPWPRGSNPLRAPVPLRPFLAGLAGSRPEQFLGVRSPPAADLHQLVGRNLPFSSSTP